MGIVFYFSKEEKGLISGVSPVDGAFRPWKVLVWHLPQTGSWNMIFPIQKTQEGFYGNYTPG
jgi:hypothetical protein